MQKTIFLFLISLMPFATQAQYYKKYRNEELDCRVKKNHWELQNSGGLVNATPWRQLYNALPNTGLGIFVHPRLVLNKWLGVGLKGEVVKMNRFESNIVNTPNYNGPTSEDVQRISPGSISSLSLSLDISPHMKKAIGITGGLSAGYYYLADQKTNFSGFESTIPVGWAVGAAGYGILTYQKFSLGMGIHFIRETGKPTNSIDYATLGIGYSLNREKKYYKQRKKY